MACFLIHPSKVKIFWEDHKKLKEISNFVLTLSNFKKSGNFFQILWPSHNIWTLKEFIQWIFHFSVVTKILFHYFNGHPVDASQQKIFMHAIKMVWDLGFNLVTLHWWQSVQTMFIQMQICLLHFFCLVSYSLKDNGYKTFFRCYVKFRYSEKATKILKISPMLSICKKVGRFFQIFGAFSVYLNFTNHIKKCYPLSTQ